MENNNTKKPFIDQLIKPGTTVDSPFATGKVDFRDRGTGGSYLLFSIKDRTGELPAVLWDVPSELKSNLKAWNCYSCLRHNSG